MLDLPLTSSRRSKYICTQGGIPEMMDIGAPTVSRTMASTLSSQSSMQLVSQVGLRFF